MIRRTVLAICFLLSACASGAPVIEEVVVSGAGFTAVQGETSLVVRTFVRDVSGERLEVPGAECEVTSSLYETRVTTPSRLVLPNFGPQSPDLNVFCRADDLSGSARRSIQTYARGAYYGPYYGYPGVYGPWGGGGWGVYGQGYVVSSYRDVAVELR